MNKILTKHRGYPKLLAVYGNCPRAQRNLDIQDREISEIRSLGTELIGETLVIDIQGFMAKDASPFFEANTVLIREQLAVARTNSKVANVVLRIDSPGGEASGTFELVNDIRALAKVKPVVAFVEDLAASAAFWSASAADRIFVNRPGQVGGIGAFALVIDDSEMFAKEGIKVIVVKSGDLKGAGFPGTKVTEEMLQKLQFLVDDVGLLFFQSVATGRGIPITKVQTKIATGEVFTSIKAQELGLIDGIRVFEQLIADFNRLGRNLIANNSPKLRRMSFKMRQLRQSCLS